MVAFEAIPGSEFFAKHLDRGRCSDAQFYSLAIDRKHANRDLVIDHDALVRLTGKDQHVVGSSPRFAQLGGISKAPLPWLANDARVLLGTRSRRFPRSALSSRFILIIGVGAHLRSVDPFASPPSRLVC
jgi:hypothetical protein